MQTELPPLRPRVSEWMQQLCQNPAALDKLLTTYGSPVNLHHTPPFVENIREIETLLDGYGIPHLVQFARKANKCKEFVYAAQSHGCGVDTASEQELKECIDAGVNTDRLILTAAIKTSSMLETAVKNHVVVVVDNEDEVRLLAQVAEHTGCPARMAVRVSGFHTPEGNLYSRFGFDVDQVPRLLGSLNGHKHGVPLEYCGLHFHLNGYSTTQRAIALLHCLDLAAELESLGFHTSFIDMGGGMLTNYLEDEEEWLTFQSELKKAVLGEREPITFGNNGLGFFLLEGRVHGELETYPYFNTTPGKMFLKRILDYKNPGEDSVGRKIADSGIQLRLEPGRCLLDQCGFTLARVAFRKKDSRGDWLVGLEMNMTQLHSSSADFLLDPMLISKTPATSTPDPVGVYFTGAYCLERDVVLKRKIPLPTLPQVGDRVAFFNTAGYMMHFFESQAHLFDLAANVIVKSLPPAPEAYRDGSRSRNQ